MSPAPPNPSSLRKPAETPGRQLGVRGRATAVALIGFGVIFLLQVTVNRHRIEDNLTARAAEKLAASYGPVQVGFTGRDGSVAVAEPGEADLVAAAVSSVPGVRTVTVVTVVTGISGPEPGSTASADAGPPPVILELKAGSVRARGSMPTAASVADLTSAMKALGRTSDVSEITIDQDLATSTDVSPAWMGRLTNLVGTVPEDDAVVLDFTTGILTVSGTVATEDEHVSIMDAAAQLVPRSAEAADGLEIAAS